MKIPPIETLPGHAGPTTWAEIIDVDPVTIWRADAVHGKLERVNPGSPKPLYSRESILRWLGVPQAGDEPASKNPAKPVKRRRRVTAAK